MNSDEFKNLDKDEKGQNGKGNDVNTVKEDPKTGSIHIELDIQALSIKKVRYL